VRSTNNHFLLKNQKAFKDGGTIEPSIAEIIASHGYKHLERLKPDPEYLKHFNAIVLDVLRTERARAKQPRGLELMRGKASSEAGSAGGSIHLSTLDRSGDVRKAARPHTRGVGAGRVWNPWNRGSRVPAPRGF